MTEASQNSPASGSRTPIAARLDSLFSASSASIEQGMKRLWSLRQPNPAQIPRRRSLSSPSSSLSQDDFRRIAHEHAARDSEDVELVWAVDDDDPYDALKEALKEEPFAGMKPSASSPYPPRPQSSRGYTYFKPPQLLDGLSRSTMPTASITQTTTPTTKSETPSRQSSILRRFKGPSSPTSADSLRSLQERQMHSSSPTKVNATTSWWFQQNKDTVDGMLDERDRAPTAEEEEQKFRSRYRAPKNPIVFCHGLLGFDSLKLGPAVIPVQVNYWRGILEVLEANGVEVLITRVPATSSVPDRAKVLEEKISSVFPGRSVHLIGHSMGGLDCRYLVTHMNSRSFKVLSVTTIATPHRGSTFADVFLSTVGRARIPSIVSLLDMLPIGGGDGGAFEFLTVENMRLFNEQTPDDPDVQYFSWGATYEPGLIDTFKWPHTVILEKEGPNDGLVSVQSSKWGTYRGTIEQVNHLDLVGWVNPARFTWAEWMGKAIKFKPATFYLDVTDFIARNVEDQDEEEGRTNEMDTHVDATDARSNEVPSAASEEEAGGTNDRESTSSDGTKSGDSTTI